MRGGFVEACEAFGGDAREEGDGGIAWSGGG